MNIDIMVMLIMCIVLTGTCSLATAKKMHKHSGVNPAESPDVVVYRSQERCCLFVCSFVLSVTVSGRHVSLYYP